MSAPDHPRLKLIAERQSVIVRVGIEEAELDVDHAAMVAIVLMMFRTEWMER